MRGNAFHSDFVSYHSDVLMLPQVSNSDSLGLLKAQICKVNLVCPLGTATPVDNHDSSVSVGEGTRINLGRAYENVPVRTAKDAFALLTEGVLVNLY